MKKIRIILTIIALGVITQISSTTDLAFDNTLAASSANEAIKIEKEQKTNEQQQEKSNPDSLEREVESVSNNTVNVDSLQEKKSPINNLGTVGRLYIPAIGINVGVNYANFYTDENYNAQDIVDREDSAAYFQFGSKTTIADHNYQGFNKIINVNNDSKAYIEKQDGTTETYQLINKFIGRNISEDLIDSSGNSVNNMNGNLVIYTCYGTDDGVMITLWDRIA